MRLILLSSTLFISTFAFAGGIYFSDRPGGNQKIGFVPLGSSTPQTLGSATDPRGVFFDAVTNRVYFGDRGGTGSIKSFDAAGGGLQTHLTGLTTISDLRPDRVNRVFYWCEESTGLIRSAPFTAVDPATPTNVFSGLVSPYYLDLDLAGGR